VHLLSGICVLVLWMLKAYCAVNKCMMWSDAEHNRAGLEEMTLLLTTAVFLVSCPSEVVLPSSLMTPCVNIFTQSWESSQAQVWPFFTACLFLNYRYLLYLPSERSETSRYAVFTFVCLCVCVHSVYNTHTHTHTTILRLCGNCPGQPG